MKENRTVHLISGVTLVTLFAKLLGIVRESLQARTFGTLAAAELYTVKPLSRWMEARKASTFGS